MTKTKKSLGIVLALLFTLFTFFSYMPVNAAAKAKAPAVPVVQFVNTPVTEYTVGDRVGFDISAPGYGGKVEYRVILWDDSNKTAHDLWNADNGYPNRYYTKWQPWGNNVFTLGWIINEPGSYRITVYAKRVGVPNNKAALKGMNCDSYKESIAFTVKPKLSVLDKEGQVYGSKDSSKPEVVKNDVRITAKNVTFNNAGVEGDMYITGDNAVVKNVTVTGKVVVDPGKDGSTTLEKVTAGKIEVLSGGKNSIHIKDVKADSLDVNSSSAVRVESDGDTKITQTVVNGEVILEVKDGSGTKLGTITVAKNASGETVVEFRGNIQDQVVVTAEATVKVAEGSKVENLVISPENPESKVVLDGTFNNVVVSKEVHVEIAAGSAVSNVEVKANAEVMVEKGAAVQTLDTNNNTVKVDNQGTITKQENTGGTTPPAGGNTPPPGGGNNDGNGGNPEVTNENAGLNSAIRSIIADMNGYSLVQTVFGSISTAGIPESGKNNTINIAFKSPYNSLKFEDIVMLARSRVISHGEISSAKDTKTLGDISNLLTNVDVNVPGVGEKTFNNFVAMKLDTLGKTRAADFFENINAANYNVLYHELTDDATKANYDSYDEIAVILRALVPGDNVTLDKITVFDNLTVQTVTVGNRTVYDYNGGDKTITLSEMKMALDPANTVSAIRDITPNLLNGKSITTTLKGTSGTVYTYTINFSVQGSN